MRRYPLTALALATILVLPGCGGDPNARTASQERQLENVSALEAIDPERETIFDLFRRADDDRRINVNKFLWAASLDVLSFLPLESADPFSGVIVTGWGRVAGSNVPYRSTVYISSPALEARSLRVAVFRQSGGRALAVSDEVAEQIEDAILTRARQFQVENDRRF